MTPTVRRVAVRGLELSVREWPSDGGSFVLVHGLASNARTWDRVGAALNAAGHRVVAVDQRGHGQSDKPDAGYGFPEVTADLLALIEALQMRRPVIAGQSWGGNVVLEFAARYPEATAGIVLVDGGFIDLSSRPGASWESISHQLRPPNLLGTPRDLLVEWFRSAHPTWDAEQIEMQMGNYETLPDGTIRPWLTLERHMEILRALWEQKPSLLYKQITVPVLIAVAEAADDERRQRRDTEIEQAASALRQVEVRHFAGAHHDIHIDQPEALSRWILDTAASGFFGS